MRFHRDVTSGEIPPQDRPISWTELRDNTRLTFTRDIVSLIIRTYGVRTSQEPYLRNQHSGPLTLQGLQISMVLVFLLS